MVDKRTIEKLETRLEQEKATLETELADIGKVDNLNPDDWHGSNGDLETGTADAAILADRFEAKTTNEGIVSALEERLLHVHDALKRIKTDTYGVCEECGEKIPMPRLEANPAASHCVEHAS